MGSERFTPDNRLRELMHDYKQSQRKLATLAGVSQRAVSDWVNGTTPLPLYAAILFAEAFDCSIDYLVNKTDENRKPRDNGNYRPHYLPEKE